MKTGHFSRLASNLFILSIFVLFSGMAPRAASAEGTLGEALSGGEASLDVRYRFEWVDELGRKDDASANTLRTRLGYQTGDFKNLSAYLEFEDIRPVRSERFNSTTNGNTQYPVVADPEDAEINQAYAAYKGIKETTVKFGRQRIILDNARFVGNVGWRQNEQTFDAVLLSSSVIPGMGITYAYIQNVNRIFGDTSASGDWRTRSHVINLSYTIPKVGKLVGYGYFLNLEDATLDTLDHSTVGGRLSGSQGVGEGLKLIYAGEFASQNDFAEGDGSIDAEYALLEGGVVLKGVTAKASFERLGGGTYGFQTPLATGHAFQGWADKFLTTPDVGVRDLYFTVSAKPFGLKLAAVYHQFSSDDKDGFDFGEELDLVADKVFAKHYGINVKYAAYHADSDPRNVGGPSVDVNKLWVTGTLKF